MQNREEMEISLRILALLEKIKTQDRELIEATDGLAGRQVPEPYLIWDILGSNEFDNKQTEDGSVHVVQHELMVNVSKSRPTGSENDSIHKVWTGHRLGFVPKRIKTRRKKPRKWVPQPEPGQPLLQAQGDAKPSHPKASTAKDRQLDSDQVQKRHERKEKAGIDGEDADEEESDDAEMNEQEQANDRGQPDEMPVQPSPGEDEASDHEYEHDLAAADNFGAGAAGEDLREQMAQAEIAGRMGGTGPQISVGDLGSRGEGEG